MTFIYQIIAIMCFIMLAALFAGSETGVYRLSRFRLRVGMEKRLMFYDLLGEMIKDGQGMIFSMLIGTNLTYYMVTSIVTYIFLSRSATASRAEFYATVLMAPILFIFCEIIPKNAYFYHSDRLMPRFTPILWVFYRLFNLSGAVPLLKAVSRFFVGLFHSPVSAETVIKDVQRYHIRQIFQETREENILSSAQEKVIGRLVNLPQARVGQAITPIKQVQMVEVNSGYEALLEALGKTAYSRLPVYEDSQGNIIGYIDICATLSEERHFSDLRRFIQQIIRMPINTGVLDALRLLRTGGQKMAIVTGLPYHGKLLAVGIVTITDLVEELTGEAG